MLRAVVLEHAAQVRDPREQKQIAEEDRGPQHALDGPEQDRRGKLMLDQAGQADRHHEEQTDREHDCDHHRPTPCCAGDLLVLLGELGIRRDSERFQPDPERLGQRDDATNHRPPIDLRRFVHDTSGERLDGDLPKSARIVLRSGLTNRDCPVRDATHHHALEHRLPAKRGIASCGQAPLALAGSSSGSAGQASVPDPLAQANNLDLRAPREP